MGALRLDALTLTLRAPEARRPEADALRARTEGVFVPEVLRAMHARLEEVFGPEAVIRIRRLRLRLSMSPDALSPGDLARGIGRELADHVAQMAPRAGPRRSFAAPDAEVQVFRGRPHLEAAELVAAAARSPGPEGAKRDFRRYWSGRAASGAPALARVLAACAEADSLGLVLSRLEVADLPILARLRGAPLPASVARAVREAERRLSAAARAADSARGSDGRGGAAGRPAHDPAPPDAVAREPRARPEGGGASPHPERRPPPTDRRVAARGRPRRLPALPDPSPDAARAAAAPPPASAKGPAVAADIPTASLDGERAPPRQAGTDAAQAEPAPDGHATGWGPLLYLLNVSLRLDLPERLWRVGVDEGEALAAMFARLSGDADDAVPGLLRPRFPDPPDPPRPLPDWARSELVGDTETEAERLAREPGLSRRIEALRGVMSGDVAWALADWGAALHLAIVEDLLGERFGPPGLAARFALHGRVVLTRNELRLTLPMNAIDADLRRAGLDTDPGWLPWLSRRCVFEFIGAGA